MSAGKNCLDKPKCVRMPRRVLLTELTLAPHPTPRRFGGPGVKKKACINRVCLNADQPLTPALRPAECRPDSLPSLDGLPDGLTRHPLLPIDSQPMVAPIFYPAQPVPEAYPVGVSKLEFLLASHGINWYR